jgi:hypothetical protein
MRSCPSQLCCQVTLSVDMLQVFDINYIFFEFMQFMALVISHVVEQYCYGCIVMVYVMLNAVFT